jgi:hypothetical protein
MEGDTVLLQDVFHRVGTAEGLGDLVPTGLRPKILDELLANGIQVPPTIFRNEADRPGRVEPPSEELYEMLAQRRRDGR